MKWYINCKVKKIPWNEKRISQRVIEKYMSVFFIERPWYMQTMTIYVKRYIGLFVIINDYKRDRILFLLLK